MRCDDRASSGCSDWSWAYAAGSWMRQPIENVKLDGAYDVLNHSSGLSAAEVVPPPRYRLRSPACRALSAAPCSSRLVAFELRPSADAADKWYSATSGPNRNMPMARRAPSRVTLSTRDAGSSSIAAKYSSENR